MYYTLIAGNSSRGFLYLGCFSSDHDRDRQPLMGRSVLCSTVSLLLVLLLLLLLYAGRQTFEARSFIRVPFAVEVFGRIGSVGATFLDDLATSISDGASAPSPRKGTVFERLRQVVSVGLTIAVSRHVISYTPRWRTTGQTLVSAISDGTPLAGVSWGLSLFNRRYIVAAVGSSRATS